MALEHTGSSGQAHLANLEARRVSSWVSLLVRAASGGDADIQTLLCSYTSLVQPPPDVMEWLEFLVATMQSLLRPLPVTDLVLKKQPWCYLSWLHLVLTDFEATQNTPRAPKTSLGAAEQQPNRLHRNQYHRPALVIWTHQSKVCLRSLRAQHAVRQKHCTDLGQSRLQL